jgi:Ca2+/H+ antiporter
MNQPSLTNVTPVTRPRPRSRTPQIAVAVLVVLIAAYLVKHFFFHESHAQHLAVVVTRALANNDMRPVEPAFNAIRRPELENHAKVGRLSDFVNAEGTFQGVKEDTPADSPAGFHHFIAHFSKGDLVETLTLDSEGKIASFQVHPEASQ